MRRFIAALRGMVKEGPALGAKAQKDQKRAFQNALQFECLEPRLTLAAAGLVDVGSQPDGGLSGKIVYVHAGHGYTTNNNGDTSAYWGFQRALPLGNGRGPGKPGPDDPLRGVPVQCGAQPLSL